MDFSSFTPFDYTIVTIILLSTLLGFFKGFVKSLLSLIRLIVAIILTPHLAPVVADLLRPYIVQEEILTFASASGAFMVCLIALSIVNYYILSLLEIVRGGFVDKSLGASFGFARGCLFTCIIFGIIVYVATEEKTKLPGMTNHATIQAWFKEGERHPKWLRKAESYQLAKMGASYILEFMPATWFDHLTLPNKVINNEAGLTILNQEQLLQQLMQALPEDPAMKASVQQAVSGFNQSSNAEKRKLLELLFDTYQSALQNGNIPESNMLTNDQMSFLKKIIVEQDG